MTHSQITRLLAATDPAGLRGRAGITLATIAAALGVTKTAVCQWEHGMRSPRGAAGAAYARFIAGLARHEAVTRDERRRAA